MYKYRKIIDIALITLCSDVSNIVKNYLKIDLILRINNEEYITIYEKKSYIEVPCITKSDIFIEKTHIELPYITKSDIFIEKIYVLCLVNVCKNIIDFNLDIINNLIIDLNYKNSYSLGFEILSDLNLSSIKNIYMYGSGLFGGNFNNYGCSGTTKNKVYIYRNYGYTKYIERE